MKNINDIQIGPRLTAWVGAWLAIPVAIICIFTFGWKNRPDWDFRWYVYAMLRDIKIRQKLREKGTPNV